MRVWGRLGREWMDVRRGRKTNVVAAFKDNGRDSNSVSNLQL